MSSINKISFVMQELEDELSELQSSVTSDMRRGSSVKELFSGKQYRKAIVIAAGDYLTLYYTYIYLILYNTSLLSYYSFSDPQ